MWKKIFISFALLISCGISYAALNLNFPLEKNYTVISAYDYYQTVKQSEQDVKRLITLLKPYLNKPDYLNQLLLLSTQYFLDRPYCHAGAEGEGNLPPKNASQRSYPHIQQDPIYRTDAFVCTTLVQTILALLHANTLNEFDQNILAIRYGAAHEPPSNIHYYNRNNFISGDFNPINQKNGIIQDVTGQGIFASYVKQTSAIIDRDQWFHRQMQPDRIKNTIRVLSEKDGIAMYARAIQGYPEKFHHFLPEKVSINYIPKEIFVKKISINGHVTYQPNESLINQLPTPSVIEVIRDVRQWKIGGKNIAEVIGSGINVSHMGLIYRQHFKQNEIIYQKISCTKVNGKKVCTVSPVVCTLSNGCTKIMFANATEAYPNGYYYYSDNKGNYHCDATPPKGVHAVECNRVISIPLEDYFTTYQYGKYIMLEEPSILGINVEKILGSKEPV